MGETGTAEIDIEAKPKEILEVICDVESYPEWMSAFKKAVLLESDDKGRPLKAEFEVDALVKTVNYVLAYKYPRNGVSWEKIDGNVREIKGEYVLKAQGPMTKVTYSYDIDPGFPVPGFLKRRAIGLMVGAALGDLKDRCES